MMNFLFSNFSLSFLIVLSALEFPFTVQMFTIITNASSGLSTISNSFCDNKPFIPSVSEKFIEQPSVSKYTFTMTVINRDKFKKVFVNTNNMASSFGWVVHKVIQQSNIILEVLDARFVDETRDKELEYKIKNRNNILITVINKCDYVDKKTLLPLKKELENCVFISAKKHLGTSMLKEKIRILAAKRKIKNPIIGVVGYPNVGKSSIINVLKGKGSARVSAEAGFTKGLQLVRISKDIMMIDTPGVMAKSKREESDLVLIAAKNPTTLEDPDLTVLKLIKNNPEIVEKHYGVKIGVDKEKTIEDIALKLNLKKKGNLPDIERASMKILRDWQAGKIKKI